MGEERSDPYLGGEAAAKMVERGVAGDPVLKKG
jgi:hypothetical protein